MYACIFNCYYYCGYYVVIYAFTILLLSVVLKIEILYLFIVVNSYYY